VTNTEEAKRVRAIFDLYLRHGALMPVVAELGRRWRTQRRQNRENCCRFKPWLTVRCDSKSIHSEARKKVGNSLWAYAKHRGVTLKAVQKAITYKWSMLEPDGRLEAARTDRDWATNSDIAAVLPNIIWGPAAGLPDGQGQGRES
jgi:hypothetical protein